MTTREGSDQMPHHAHDSQDSRALHDPQDVQDTTAHAADPALREALESRLTAHALGQLEEEERAAIELLLADPARHEARQMVAEVRAVAEALRAGRPADGTPRSADLRRAVVAAVAATAHEPTEPAPVITVADSPRQRQRHWNRWLAIAGTLSAAVLVMALVSTTGLQFGQPARQVAVREAGETASARAVVRDENGIAKQSTGEAAGAAAARPPTTPMGMPMPMATDATRHDLDQLQRQIQPAAPAEPAAPAPRRQLAPPGYRPPKADAAAKGERSESSARKAAGDAGSALGDIQAGQKANQAMRAPAAAAIQVGEQTRLLRAAPAPEFEQQPDRERYNHFAEHRFRAPADAPLSTFSIDVDTASYANVRRFLTAGRLPPADAVRIEELVNYFRYDYPQPAGDDPFAVAVEVAECPWRTGHRLVRVGLQGRTVDRRERPAGNLVFLVDVSGSMGAADKLPLVKQALAMLVEELTENDSVAIVTYAGNAGVRLPATSGDQKGRILEAIESLVPGGSTHGSAGITLAYEQAAEGFIEGGANRVILATDGDLNVGITNDADLVELIRRQAAGGTFLTVLGFGTGNLQDEKMEKLSANGNGIYAYIDSAREARKVLVEQLTGSTITIAKDVKIQVEFNPAQVASYRLLGYENRALAAEDFRDDRKDAGEIGAGHSVTAVYEIALVDEAAAATTGAEPLKYQPQPETSGSSSRPAIPRVDPDTSRELLTVKLRFKRPEGTESVLREVPVADRGGAFAAASADLRFAAAVAAFGMILRESPAKGQATLPLVASIAGAALGPDQGGYRAEFLDLVRKAQALRHE